MSSVVINQTNTMPHHPPGPKGHWLWGTVREFQTNPLQAMTDLQKNYGDAVRFRFILNYYGYLFCHPDHNKHILQDNNRNYTKMPHPSFVILQPLVGNGLLTSDGDFWRRQRRLAQPAFHRRRIAEFGRIMTDATQTMLDRWHTNAQNGQPLDLEQEMAQLTLKIAGQALFSIDLTAEAQKVGEAFTAVNHQIAELSVRPLSDYTIKLPWFPSTRRINKNVQILTEVVDKVIDERRAHPTASANDLLAMLMEAQDEETGEGMDNQQLRDEVMTLMLAGHETTANTLNWVFYLLGQHLEVQQKLEDELQTVLNGRLPTIADLPQLTYTRMIIDETLRLYPVAFAMARWGNEADQIGDYDIMPNAVITLSPYLTHRHPQFWPEPEKFDPERFTPENQANRPRYAYIPFGGGPRQCIGNTFALTEATLLLATIAQRYRLQLVPNHPVVPEPLVTLRPMYGMPVTLSPRTP